MGVEPTRVVLEPGGQAPVTVTVRNPGQRVEGYRLTVHGAAAGWADVVTGADPEPGEADVVRVWPGKESTATVVFTAPAGSAGMAGRLPFAVLARSVVDESSSAAAEGDLEIGRVDGLSATLTPVTSTGRWSGRHTVKVSNWGNAPATLRLVASDADDALDFLVHPERMELRVGGSAVAAVRVRSRRPFLRGQKVRLPFRVVAESDPPPERPVAGPPVSTPQRPVLDGALDQRPVLTRGTVALGLLGALALGAAAVVAVTAEPAPVEEQVVTASLAAPAGLAVEPVDSGSVRLRWEQLVRRPESFRVLQIDPATREQRPPVVVQPHEADGEQDQLTVDELPPDTEVCFQVAAVVGERRSPSTDPVCGRTRPAEPSGTPSPATVAEPSGGGAGGAGGAAPTTTGAATTGPSSAGTGTGGESSGGTSAGGDSPGATATGSTTASGTGPVVPPTPVPTQTGDGQPFGPDDWLIGRLTAKGETNAAVLAERRLAELTGLLTALDREDLRVAVLDSAQYPGLGFTNPTLYAAVGPFASRTEAEAACAALGVGTGSCVARQPGARS